MERVEWSGDILELVAQEASALVELLCEQSSGVLDRIFALVESKTLDQIQSLANTRDRVTAIVEYFKTSDRNLCKQFLASVYQYSENTPFLLETTLVSIAGYTPGKSCSTPFLDILFSYAATFPSSLFVPYCNFLLLKLKHSSKINHNLI